MSKINTDCKYIRPDLCKIPEGTRIRSLSTDMDRQLLDNLRKTAVCPDDISYWFWRNFSSDLAPVITMIFNRFLIEGTVPDLWKRQTYYHFQKNLRSRLVISKLRLISLTAINTNLCLSNSSYPTRPHSIIVYYTETI